MDLLPFLTLFGVIGPEQWIKAQRLHEASRDVSTEGYGIQYSGVDLRDKPAPIEILEECVKQPTPSRRDAAGERVNGRAAKVVAGFQIELQCKRSKGEV